MRVNPRGGLHLEDVIHGCLRRPLARVSKVVLGGGIIVRERARLRCGARARVGGIITVATWRALRFG